MACRVSASHALEPARPKEKFQCKPTHPSPHNIHTHLLHPQSRSAQVRSRKLRSTHISPSFPPSTTPIRIRRHTPPLGTSTLLPTLEFWKLLYLTKHVNINTQHHHNTTLYHNTTQQQSNTTRLHIALHIFALFTLTTTNNRSPTAIPTLADRCQQRSDCTSEKYNNIIFPSPPPASIR